MPKRAFDPTDAFVGKRVKYYRHEKGWSQTDLAGHLNITFQQVQKYENGSNRIGAGRLAKIAALLEKPVSAFYPVGINPAAEGQVFELVDTPQAMRLLLAYNSIENSSARSALTAMAEALGGTGPVGKRRAA